AITLASPLVFPDVNTGSVTIHGNGVTINANGRASGLGANAEDVTFDHFSLTGVCGRSDGSDAGAIRSEGREFHIAKCRMNGNAVHAVGHDAGVALSEGSALTVSSCTITGNSVRSDSRGDAGVVVSEGGGLTASACTVSSNHVNAAGDGATLL